MTSIISKYYGLCYEGFRLLLFLGFAFLQSCDLNEVFKDQMVITFKLLKSSGRRRWSACAIKRRNRDVMEENIHIVLRRTTAHDEHLSYFVVRVRLT